MQRNRNDYFSSVPTPHMPRYQRDLGVHSRLSTFKHGHLIPFYSRLVYPHSNLKMQSTAFIRMDTSLKVPLDDVFFDTYFFFVPLRIIDPNFEKILGYKNTYDSHTYNFPIIQITANDSMPLTHDSLFQYFGWQATSKEDDPTGYLVASVDTNDNTKKLGGYVLGSSSTPDVVNTYQLAAYYIVYNQYFRDETLDPEVPVSNLLTQGVTLDRLTLSNNPLFNMFDVLKVNRYHDIFSSGLVTPTGAQGDVKIPLGTSLVPVLPQATEHTTSSMSQFIKVRKTSDGSFPTNNYLLGLQNSSGVTKIGQYTGSVGQQGFQSVYFSNLYADMSKATGPSIQQLYLSMALYSLYDKRGTFGSRMIEQIRGSFGLEVPDGLVDRAEYLSGNCQTLNNTPVLNTANDQGEMVGNSATLLPVTTFDKGFNEWGFVIGVCCTRCKHYTSQGISNPAWKIFDNLDLYWPEFANIGKMGTPKYRIYNNPDSSTNNDNFNYTDAWIDQETEQDIATGDFGSLRHANVTELQRFWSYQDIYGSAPSFSSSWLKEPINNLARTLSGLLIPNSSDIDHSDYSNQWILGGHQFMVQFKYHPVLTLAKPPRSQVPNITGRI